MKKIRWTYLTLFMVGLVGVVHSQIIDRPLATVRLNSTTVITQRQIQSKIAILEEELGVTMDREQKMSLLNSDIDTELIMQAAARDTITATEDEIARAIAQQRQSLGLGANVSDAVFREIIQEQAQMTWEEYRDRLRRRIIQEKYVAQDNQALLTAPYTPTATEIDATYQENVSQFLSPAYVRFDHLFIDTRNKTTAQVQELRTKMQGFLTQIRNGGAAAFTRLVQASIDDPTYSGGDFGFLPRGEQTTQQLLGRSFIDGVFALEQGRFSDLLESNLGFHLVRITDKRQPKLLTLSDPVTPGGTLTVQAQIIQYLQAEKQQERMVEAVNGTASRLRNQAEVQIFTQNISW
ncbi:MAG: hypothetical protein GW949_03105 [Spirochaetales bacterium]|nr:hypothetical protein [Spirochaetales bacterium]